tara:strand:- start:496 stop:1050 length:555 start_codon:yes stop_codon:yes gene_type:complete
MTSKKNIISFPDNLKIKLSGIDTLRLHEHGQAIFVHLSFDEELSSIQSSFLIKQILVKGMLDFQLTDFMFNRAKGFHGPFKSKLLKNSDFKKIDESNFFESIRRIITKERKDTPLILDDRKDAFMEKVELMTKKETDFFILDRKLSNEPKKFEHEWSHAITEYHEFLILNYSSNNIFCLLLAYD